MPKKNKLKTPEWILGGYDTEADYLKARGKNPEKKKGKIFRIRECPKCRSDNVGVVLSNSDAEEDSKTGKEWECHKCGWREKNISKKELNEDEFMEYMDKKEKLK